MGARITKADDKGGRTLLRAYKSEAKKAHGSSKDGQSASADVVFAPPCPEPQKSTDPVRQPGRAALQEQSISSSSRRSTPSASTMPPAEGHTKHEKCGSTERRVSKSTSRLRSGTPTSADIAAQHCPQTGRSAPAGRCPSSEISDPESGRPSGRPSAFAAAASAQEHANLHVAPAADPQPALKELQTQPGQTPFAAAALAQSSPRSAEEVSEAPAAQDASPWALTEAPVAVCAAATPRSRGHNLDWAALKGTLQKSCLAGTAAKCSTLSEELQAGAGLTPGLPLRAASDQHDSASSSIETRSPFAPEAPKLPTLGRLGAAGSMPIYSYRKATPLPSCPEFLRLLTTEGRAAYKVWRGGDGPKPSQAPSGEDFHSACDAAICSISPGYYDWLSVDNRSVSQSLFHGGNKDVASPFEGSIPAHIQRSLSSPDDRLPGVIDSCKARRQSIQESRSARPPRTHSAARPPLPRQASGPETPRLKLQAQEAFLLRGQRRRQGG